MPKRVLIITYYWPPSGGAGVQRWLKFVKYLPKYGWDPIIYTVENGEYPVLDPDLVKDIPEGIEVLKTPVWEPYSWYKKFTGRKKEDKINSSFLSEKKKSRFFENISVWIRGNIFIPDARKFWIDPSIRFLSNYLDHNQVDAIISSGPPHSMHIIALGLKSKFNLPWIADFRDPWTNIDYYKDLKLTKRADKKHKRLEREVLEGADVTLTIGASLGEELAILGSSRVEVIENGYDPSDFSQLSNDLDSKFTIAHIGSFTPSRNHIVLWEALSQLVKENSDFSNNFQLKLIGKVDHSVKESISQYDLLNHVKFTTYLSHSEVIKEQSNSKVLLLMINNTPNAKGIITGKVFEYIFSGRPTLVIGPSDGDAAKLIKECNAGVVCGYNDVQNLKNVIIDLFKKKIEFNSDASNYSRIELTLKLSDLLNDLTE